MGNESTNPFVFLTNPTHYCIRHTIPELSKALLRTFASMALFNKVN
jgi:hypothetical protein